MKFSGMLFNGSLLLALSAGCGDSGETTGTGGGGGSGGAGGGNPTVDDAAVSADAADYKTLTKLNSAPFMSAQHQGQPMVNVYVNGVASATYAKVADGAALTFAEGSLIVKEMLDPEGEPMMLTAMYKGPEGYDAENADWWWGMLTLDGMPAQSGSVGKVALCSGCHGARETTDFAFGIPQ